MEKRAGTQLPPEVAWALITACLVASRTLPCYSAKPQDAERQAWLHSVAEALHISIDALPDSPNEDDIRRLPAIPAEEHGKLLQLLVLASLHVPEHLPGSGPKGSAVATAYSALSRALLYCTADLLRIPAELVLPAEQAVATQLLALLQHEQQSGSSTDSLSSAGKSAVAAAKSSGSAWKWAATGAGAILGGVAIGLTGGLAAPLIVGASGGLLGIFAGSGGAIALGSLLGVAGSGLGAYRTNRRLQGVDTFEFVDLKAPPSSGDKPAPAPSLSAVVCCSGFLLKPADATDPFRSAFASSLASRDVYAVKADPDDFLAAGQALDAYVKDYIVKKGAVEVVKRTALAAIYTAVALPMSVYGTLSTLLDNRYQRISDKASKAGLILADVLASEVQGKRPVTLVGSSLGAATVFRALLELHQRGLDHLVCDAILISSPLSPSPDDYVAARSAVARRFVNVRSSDDWVLALLARLHSLSYRVAGLQLLPDGLAERLGIEELDVSDLLSGHLNLAQHLPAILARVDLAK